MALVKRAATLPLAAEAMRGSPALDVSTTDASEYLRSPHIPPSSSKTASAAVQNGQEDWLDILLEAGRQGAGVDQLGNILWKHSHRNITSSINDYRLENETPLCKATETENLNAVEFLLSVPGIDVQKSGGYERTPLHIACQKGHMGIVELLLRAHRVNVNARDHQDNTPLHLACDKGDATIVEALLNIHGIDLNAKNNLHNTPLHRACW